MKPDLTAKTRQKHGANTRGQFQHTTRQPSPYGPHSAPKEPPDRREAKQALRRYLSH